MKANAKCIPCILKKQKLRATHIEGSFRQKAFLDEANRVIYEEAKENSAPFLSYQMDVLFEKYGTLEDYTEIKKKYNQYMLSKEEQIYQAIRNHEDPIIEGIKYISAGNYIDFGALDIVDDTILETLIEKASDDTLSENEIEYFKKDLERAKNLVYLCDNCGEIVCDKAFIRVLKEIYPKLHITCIVRGQNVLNDATIEDAKMVGLDTLCTVLGNGTRIPGTVCDEINSESREAIKNADMILSKGQGNFESMYGEHLNTYFCFLCKCELFVQRFGLRQFESVFIREDHIKKNL